jgi:hypothetical protein
VGASFDWNAGIVLQLRRKLCGKIVAVKNQRRSKEIGTVIMKGAMKSGRNT